MSQAGDTRGFARDSEVIATYVTCRFYNDLYSVAREKHATDARSTSLTEKYAAIVASYIRDIEAAHKSPGGRDDILNITIGGLHSYYCRYVMSCAASDFIAQVIVQVVPADFRDTVNVAQKEAMFRDIVAQNIIAIGARVLTKEMLAYIIDKREDRSGVEILREVGIKVIADYRSSLIAKLYAPRDSAHVSRTINIEVFDKVRNELINTVKECAALSVENKSLTERMKRMAAEYEKVCAKVRADTGAQEELERAKDVARQMSIQLDGAKSRIAELEAQVKHLSERVRAKSAADSEIAGLRAQIADLQNKLRETLATKAKTVTDTAASRRAEPVDSRMDESEETRAADESDDDEETRKRKESMDTAHLDGFARRETLDAESGDESDRSSESESDSETEGAAIATAEDMARRVLAKRAAAKK